VVRLDVPDLYHGSVELDPAERPVLFSLYTDSEESLWTPFCAERRRYYQSNRLSNWWGTNGPNQRMNLLWRETHIWSSTPKGHRGKLLNLSFSELERVLQTVDGIILPLYFSSREKENDLKPLLELRESVMAMALTNVGGLIILWKRFSKEVRKSSMTGRPWPVLPSQLAKLRFVSLWKEKKFRIPGRDSILITLTAFQARGLGLAEKVITNRSLKKFKDNMTAPVSNRSLNMNHLRVVLSSAYTEGRHSWPGVFPLTLSSHSCLESPRSKGGKMGYFRRWVTNSYLSGRRWPAVDPETGSILSRDGVTPIYLTVRDFLPHPQAVLDTLVMEPDGTCSLNSGNISQMAYSYALYLERYELIPKDVRVSTIAETGKSRIITVPSFWRYVLQYPIYKRLIRVFEDIPETRKGLTAGDHLFQVTDHSFPKGELFSGCSDLSEATDHLEPGVAKSMLMTVFSIVGGPRWATTSAIADFCEPSNMVLESGESFTSNGNGQMGLPLAKVALTAASLWSFFTPLKGEPSNDVSRILLSREKHITSIVGDDFMCLFLGGAIVRGVNPLTRWQENCKNLGLKISEADTFTSKYAGILAEKAIYLPLIPRGGKVRQLLRDGHSGSFLMDHPKLRLFNTVRGDGTRLSETSYGRASQIRDGLSYLRGDPLKKDLWRSFLEWGISVNPFLKGQQISSSLGGAGLYLSWDPTNVPLKCLSTMLEGVSAISAIGEVGFSKERIYWLFKARASQTWVDNTPTLQHLGTNPMVLSFIFENSIEESFGSEITAEGSSLTCGRSFPTISALIERASVWSGYPVHYFLPTMWVDSYTRIATRPMVDSSLSWESMLMVTKDPDYYMCLNQLWTRTVNPFIKRVVSSRFGLGTRLALEKALPYLTDNEVHAVAE